MKCLAMNLAALGLAASLGAASVLTQHNDNARTGANLGETLLTVSNVNPGLFGKLFARAVDGQIYGQPLVMNNVSIPGRGIHNVVYVATEHNSVYAFDADDPSASAPLWQVNLGPSAPCPNSTWGNNILELQPEIGILGTPAIDPGAGVLYCVAFVNDSSGTSPSYYLHALSLATGVDMYGGPVLISGQVAGSSPDSSNGVLTFNSPWQNQRAALLLDNGLVYVAFGAHAEQPPFHGWLFAYNARSLARAAVLCTTPDDQRGGIWQGGQGPSADGSGAVYVISSTGPFNYPQGTSISNTVIKLRPGAGAFSILDWFTPYNVADLTANLTEVGSTSPVMVPGTNWAYAIGKQGVFYLMDRSNLGKFHSGSDAVLDSFPAVNGRVFGAPVYWNSPLWGPVCYLWAENDVLKALPISTSATGPVASGNSALPDKQQGAILSLSANNSDRNSGILWAVHADNADPGRAIVPGLLHAYDASNLSNELWNSKMNAARDDFGNFTKFCPPTVANGKVYMATASQQLVTYGLFSSQTSTAAAAVPVDEVLGPQPLHQGQSLCMSTGSPSTAVLDLYDLAAHRVASVRFDQAATSHCWGASLLPGVYLARLQITQGGATRARVQKLYVIE